MSLFEDLIEELKEENLIEETVIEKETRKNKGIANAGKSVPFSPTFSGSTKDQIEENNIETPSDLSVNSLSAAESPSTEKQPEQSEVIQLNDTEKESNRENEIVFERSLVEESSEKPEENKPNPEESFNDRDFYRRRATEEVASLQIVEHVITGVEREQMKVRPKPYDDMAVSLALHDFLKLKADPQSPEHSQAEFKLMGETESWHSALSQRDKIISVGDLRRYCESVRPSLSPQALAALARFYRNSAFSDAVRNKFDLIMTRLVTKELKNHKREILFERNELIKHLSDLYADWSSIPVYASDDDSDVLLAALKFEDFINEAKEAGSFEELVKRDFFNRLRVLKDSTGENFFSPLLTATAIECNVIVGNRYVELINADRENHSPEILEEKYNFLVNQPVSSVTSKTFQLVELLKSKKVEVEEKQPETIEIEENTVSELSAITETQREVEPEAVASSGGKKLLLAALLAVVLIGGLYFLTSYFSASPDSSPVAEKVNLEESAFAEYFKAARINENTFYGVAQPSWKDLADVTKEEVLRKTMADGVKKGYSKVQIMDADGKTVGTASAEEGVKISGF